MGITSRLDGLTTGMYAPKDKFPCLKAKVRGSMQWGTQKSESINTVGQQSKGFHPRTHTAKQYLGGGVCCLGGSSRLGLGALLVLTLGSCVCQENTTRRWLNLPFVSVHLEVRNFSGGFLFTEFAVHRLLRQSGWYLWL